MMTQWRNGMSGMTGLDYNCLPFVMKMLNVQDEQQVFSDIQIMEAAALKQINK